MKVKTTTIIGMQTSLGQHPGETNKRKREKTSKNFVLGMSVASYLSLMDVRTITLFDVDR